MRAHLRRFCLASLILLLLLLTNLSPAFVVQARTHAADMVVYDDALGGSWADWSYKTTIDLNSATHHNGAKGISVTLTADGGALSFHTSTPISGAEYVSISFWVFGAAGDSHISFFLGDSAPAGAIKAITAPAGVWTNFVVPLSDLGSPATFVRVNWQGAEGPAQPTFYVDDITIKAATSTGIPDATADGTRTIDPGPSGVAVAPNGRVYVASYHADVVYSWASVSSMTSADGPDKVFGDDQTGDPDGAGCKKAPSATILCGPESIAVDGQGNLFVADTYHHRILVFLNPDTDATPQSSDTVLGQPDFATVDPDYDSNNADGILEGLCYVRGLAVDSSDRLWAVDEFNFRVIRFDTPLVNASLPSKVLGQADLDNHPATCDANAHGDNGVAQFGLPLGVAVDQAGTLYVTDFYYSRIQRFAANAANGADAEASYTSVNGIDHAHDVAVDASGNLYAANTFKDELLVFAGGPSGDLTSDHTFPNRNYPMGLAFTAKGDLLVADCGGPAAGKDYPPCVSGVAGARGVFFFAAPAPPTFLPPDAKDDSVSTLKDSAVNGNVLGNDSDPQDSALTVTAHTEPQHGTVAISPNGKFTYTPKPGYVGKDSFTYTATNEHNLNDTATVAIDVTAVKPPDQPPTAVNDSFQTHVNIVLKGNVLTNDSDPQDSPLTVKSFTKADHGAVTIAANGAFTYTPLNGFVGQAQFGYTVSNGDNLTDNATVTVNVVAEQSAYSKLFVPHLAR